MGFENDNEIGVSGAGSSDLWSLPPSALSAQASNDESVPGSDWSPPEGTLENSAARASVQEMWSDDGPNLGDDVHLDAIDGFARSTAEHVQAALGLAEGLDKGRLMTIGGLASTMRVQVKKAGGAGYAGDKSAPRTKDASPREQGGANPLLDAIEGFDKKKLGRITSEQQNDTSAPRMTDASPREQGGAHALLDAIQAFDKKKLRSTKGGASLGKDDGLDKHFEAIGDYARSTLAHVKAAGKGVPTEELAAIEELARSMMRQARVGGDSAGPLTEIDGSPIAMPEPANDEAFLPDAVKAYAA